MNNCSYCSNLAVNRCISCSLSMCDKHISDHVKDFSKEHKIAPHLYDTDLSKDLKIQKKITKRIILLLNLKNEIFKQTNEFIKEINDLYAISIKKIDEKLNIFMKLSILKSNLNYIEYQQYLSTFKVKIETELVYFDEPKKYFNQNFFKEVDKNIELKNEFEYLDNGGEIFKIDSINDQKFYYSNTNQFLLFDSKTKTSLFQCGCGVVTRSINIPGLNILVSGLKSGYVVIWNLPNLSIKVEKQIQTSAVSGLAITSDYKFVVYASFQGPIRIINIVDLNTLREIQTSGLSITCMALTANNIYIVSGTDQNQLAIWNFTSSVKEYELLGHKSSVKCVIISRDDKYIVSGSEDNIIKIWDMHSKDCLTNLIGHTDHITTLNFTINDKYIISGSKDSTIRLWDLKKNKSRGALIGHSGYVNCVDVSADGKWVYSGSSDKKIRGWCLEKTIL